MGTFRNKCVYRNFIRYVEACKSQQLINSQTLSNPQANRLVLNNLHANPQVLNHFVSGPSNNAKTLPEPPKQLEEQQQLIVGKSELEIVLSLPKKQFVKTRKSSSNPIIQPSEKRKRAFEMVRSMKKQKCNPKISNLSRLTSTSIKKSHSTKSVKKSRSTKTTLVPPVALAVYANVKHLLKNVESVIESYFDDQENEDPRADMASMPGLTIVHKKLRVEVPSTVKRRNACVKFHRGLTLYAMQLAQSILLSVKSLDVVKSTLYSVPVYPRHVRKLQNKLDKAYMTFFAKPVHKHLKTVQRQSDLVAILIRKFDIIRSRQKLLRI